MSELLGYIAKTSNIVKIESILKEARDNVHRAALKEYHRMLSEELAELVDDIALNVTARPECPLFNVAVERLNAKISGAEMSSSGTEYDLRAFVTIFPQPGATYFLLNVSNAELEKAFLKTHGVDAYKVSDADVIADTRSEKAEKWDEIRKRSQTSPSILSASLTTRLEAEVDRITFIPPTERAQTRARRSVTSRLMNQYACGKEIRASELMPILDKALMRLEDKDVQEELREKTSSLMTLLPTITKAMVSEDPRRTIGNCGDEGVDEKSVDESGSEGTDEYGVSEGEQDGNEGGGDDGGNEER